MVEIGKQEKTILIQHYKNEIEKCKKDIEDVADVVKEKQIRIARLTEYIEELNSELDVRGKKVIKEIVYCTVEEVKNETRFLGIIIDGVDLLNMDMSEALDILNKNGMINSNNDIVVPVGMILSFMNEYGGSSECVFNDGFLILDLNIKNEYFG